MKRMLSIAIFALFLSITVACGNKEGKETGSSAIPVKWANAEVQMDQSKLLDLLDKKETALDPEDKPDSKEKIKNYKLTEWRANKDRYFYEIVFENPIKKDIKTEKMEVIKTKKGWKKTEYGNVYNFDEFVEDLKPKVLKELHDE
jgi:hypothetical protein